MRASTIVLAVAAAVSVNALNVNRAVPVTQISDGQIQVPPSTAVIVAPSTSAEAYTTVAPVSTVAPASSSVVVVVPVPSYPAGNSSSVAVVASSGSVVSSAVLSKAPTTIAATATTPAGTTVAASATTAAGTGAAVALNAMGSLSFAALAMAGFVLA